MRSLRIALLLGCLFVAKAYAQAQVAAKDVRGLWLVEKKDAHIKVYLAKNGK